MLELVSFLCGGSVMVLEMAGSRLLAPYLGTSIVVWTALIGVILASLSLGYWLGGKFGDRTPTAPKLARIILGAAAFVMLAALIQSSLVPALAAAGLPLEVSAVLAALLLFTAPSVLLGMVSPYIIQVKLARLKNTGQDTTGAVMGRFFALSTLGSILGTFLGGYFLIALVGSHMILYGVGASLVISALLCAPQQEKMTPLALLGLAVGMMIFLHTHRNTEPIQGLSIDTRYNHLSIAEGRLAASPRPMRFLITDPGSIQSGMYLDAPQELALDYTRHYALAWHAVPGAKRFLMLGGGGYSVPKHLLHTMKDMTVDVVEIDPGITEAARNYFALPDDPRLTIHHEDARIFLNKHAVSQPGSYDVIMGDTFTSSYNIPFHLGTVECARQIHALLQKDGVFACNIISAVTGDKGKVFRAIRSSFAAVFPQVHTFQVNSSARGDNVQNIMILALKTPRPLPLAWNDDLRALLATEWTQPIADDTPALTDDYAPVERYAMAILRGR